MSDEAREIERWFVDDDGNRVPTEVRGLRGELHSGYWLEAHVVDLAVGGILVTVAVEPEESGSYLPLRISPLACSAAVVEIDREEELDRGAIEFRAIESFVGESYEIAKLSDSVIPYRRLFVQYGDVGQVELEIREQKEGRLEISVCTRPLRIAKEGEPYVMLSMMVIFGGVNIVRFLFRETESVLMD